MRKIYLMVLLIFLVTGCQVKNKDIDDQHLTEEKLLEQGDLLTGRAQQALGSQLKKAIQDGGPVHAVAFCNAAALHTLDTLTIEGNFTIKRTALRIRNPENEPTYKEREVLITYQDQLAAGKSPQPALHDIGNGQMLFTKPILLDNPLCLNCHGTPNVQISSETYAKIQELYPEDQAVGFEMGDLRGMWSVTMESR
jgi:hypothetical protein